ncbi:MAG: serine/threonine protein kinase [Labilithrix sp.]|nr:serine/threonine protein kinase [Labilithrix sp.]MCW5818239.1 serine/threonine protein kinase [Labilithrix sp.]
MAGDVSRYSLGRILGRGGNATVYEALDRKTRRRVALKVLPETHLDSITKARFSREARTAASIRHPNVCEVYESGFFDDGRPYVAMELLEGESLREVLIREGRLEEEEALEIGVQILAGLQAAHEAGVIHRDVKPENVFVTRARGRVTVKVLDFGTCRRIDHSLDSQTLTLTGFVVGTPGYLSPEQAYGERDLDARADLFSVGLILFEALTGRPGFLGRTCAELMDGVSIRVPRVTRYRSINWMFDAIVSKATEPNLRERYASAAEMQHDLLEARTVMRREGSHARKAAQAAATRPAPVVVSGSDCWDVPTQRYVA